MRRKVEIETVTCDICGRETECQQVNYPVMFHTEQTEGRACKPYISNQNIDLCDVCFKKVIMVHASGAQGYNQYSIVE